MHRSFEDLEQTTPEPNVPFGARELEGVAEGGLSEQWLAFTHFARSCLPCPHCFIALPLPSLLSATFGLNTTSRAFLFESVDEKSSY